MACLAQQYIQTIKYRNNRFNGVKTSTQLNYPAVCKGPRKLQRTISWSLTYTANDKNETLGFVHKNDPKPPTSFWQIAQYLCERDFAVLRYDKRGVRHK